jgi:hypothetical protein
MKLFRFFLLSWVLAIPYFAVAEDVTFRKPFTLTLYIDKEHYYEEKFDKIPYVHDGAIYLFKGDVFGVNLNQRDGVITEASYVSSSHKADIAFEFKQEIEKDGTQLMLLKITNNTEKRIFMDALMTVPNRNGILKTSILPLEPSLSGYESWPHPIVQLVLTKFRTTP